MSAVNGVKDGAPAVYATGVAYAPQGGLGRLTLGNGRLDQWCYNEARELGRHAERHL